ncbi:BON domain-containing protein [Chitinophaga niastensis]|uniref:BON domain-containing protein n=1 Tax=Chitinophaga niastensis TaxID=536980 RepID=A0A2P8HCA3_CHINA|nr:BON domain-containing protein [Chitinophaga niastensis]PSL43834.1 BON domain-containing protein [Chitinophaga niastensis]
MTMRIKQLASIVLVMGLMLMVACKGKPKDADIQAAVTSSLTAIPGVTADVKDGAVTLSGQVASEADKTAAEAAAKASKDVKSVTNNITVAAPVAATPQVAITADDALKTGVAAVVKDFPGITADVKDGIISIKGESTAAKWKTLKMALDALKPKRVDASGLKVK